MEDVTEYLQRNWVKGEDHSTWHLGSYKAFSMHKLVQIFNSYNESIYYGTLPSFLFADALMKALEIT